MIIRYWFNDIDVLDWSNYWYRIPLACNESIWIVPGTIDILD